MPPKEIKPQHASGDHLITSLLSNGGIVGEFINAYPGIIASHVDTNWLQNWFQARTDYYLKNDKVDPNELSSKLDGKQGSLSVQESVVTVPTRLISVQPNYF